MKSKHEKITFLGCSSNNTHSVDLEHSFIIKLERVYKNSYVLRFFIYIFVSAFDLQLETILFTNTLNIAIV